MKKIIIGLSLLLIASSIFYLISCNKKAKSPSVVLSKNNKFEKYFTDIPKSQLDSLRALETTTANSNKPNSSVSSNSTTARMDQTENSSYGCGSYMSGDYYGTGNYYYPADTLDVSSSILGSTITLSVNSYDVPNNFTVYDSAGSEVASSGWMGHVSYSGPWGMSLNTPETKNLTFHYGTSSKFTLKVQTVTSSASDSWQASLYCNYVPNIVIDTINNATYTTIFENMFDSLTYIDFGKLSADLGLSDTLKKSDIDFTNLILVKDTNDPDSGRAFEAQFKSNSGSNLRNYCFGVAISSGDTLYSEPYITEATSTDSLNYFNLSEGSVGSILNFTTTSPTFEYYDSNFGSFFALKPCGHTTMHCITDAYENHGWTSVLLTIVSARIWVTVLLVASDCAVQSCF